MSRPHLRRMLLLWTLAACAVVSQSATPASGAAPADEPRLNQRVTLDLTQVPLSDLCWVMAQRTGVAHRVADPATGDLLIDAVGTLTVAQLHQALAAVLGVGWKWNAKGSAPGYVVERLPEKQMEELREQAETDRAYGDGLRRLLADANLPDDAREQLPFELKSRLGAGNREAVQLLGDLTPAEEAQVLAGGGVERPLASLPPAAQARVKTLLETEEQRFNERADASLAEPGTPGSPRLRRREHPLDLEDGQAWRIRIDRPAKLTARGSAFYMVSISSPQEPGIGLGIGVPLVPPEHQNPARYRLSVTGAEPAAPDQAGANHSDTTPNTEQPLLPKDLLPPGRSWEEAVRDLARTLGCPVVSDAYRPPLFLRGSIGPPVKGDTLDSYLDRACRFALDRRWARAGSVLLFQRCDWATQRQGQIPESQVRRWKQQIIDTGRLSLAHLAEMASLTPYELPNAGDIIGSQADRVMEHQQLLLLWKALPESSQTALRGEGLALRDLPLAVQPRARALVSEMLGSSAPLLLANATLKVEQTDDAFTFSVLLPGQPAVRRQIDLTCPPWWPAMLRKEAETRAAALQAAARM